MQMVIALALTSVDIDGLRTNAPHAIVIRAPYFRHNRRAYWDTVRIGCTLELKAMPMTHNFRQIAEYCWLRAHQAKDKDMRSWWFDQFEVAITLADMD